MTAMLTTPRTRATLLACLFAGAHSEMGTVVDVERALSVLEREDHGKNGMFVRDGSSTLPEAAKKICTLNIPSKEACDLSGMPRDASYLVRPGGKTRCLLSTTTPFQFEVLRGDTDKLLLFFQGGGACWDQLSTDITACSSGAFPQGPHGGLFDRSNPENPFREYTLVHVLYCDGSVHGGNVTRRYRDSAGEPVQQTGYENAKSVLDWIAAQMDAGQLASPLASLVISGCSAGSIGAQLWADHALTRLPHAAAAVVPDSYAGVFPKSAEGRLIAELGFCTSPLLAPMPAALRKACTERRLSLHAITAAVTARHPTVAFGHVQSKTDIVQQAFNVALSADPTLHPFGCFDPATCFAGPERLYAVTNEYFEEYNRSPNHVHFFIQADQHCYLPNAHVYRADPSGAGAGGKGGERLVTWLGRLPLRAGSNASIATQCAGADRKPPWVGAHYCDAHLAHKRFDSPTAVAGA